MIHIDKIYSRPRIRVPNLNKPVRNKKTKKIYYFSIIWIIVIFTVFSINKFMGPIFETICIEEAKKIGTNILNIESTKVLKDVDYNDLIIVEKAADETIQMVKSNVILINVLSSDITYNIQKRLSALDKEKISISMGSLSGNRFLSGVGPNINLKIVPVGSVETKFESEFIEKGINQTMHKLYLIVDCEIDILTPYDTITTHIVNQVLFAENIIVGEVPNSYYNLEGLQSSDALEVVD